MVMFYILALYGFMGAIFVLQQPTLLYWSNFIQLIALPLLLVGTNLLGRGIEKRDKETHDTVIKEFRIIKEENKLIKTEVKLIKEELSLQRKEKKAIEDAMAVQLEASNKIIEMLKIR